MQIKCSICQKDNTIYAPFTAGQEYYCYDCEDNFQLKDDQERPRRVQMMADGKFAQLHRELKQHFNSQ